MKELPTIEQMQNLFPDYPCGREKCKYQGNQLFRARRCSNVDCPEFKAWFVKHWAKICGRKAE
jgi:hypothetical protein